MGRTKQTTRRTSIARSAKAPVTVAAAVAPPSPPFFPSYWNDNGCYQAEQADLFKAMAVAKARYETDDLFWDSHPHWALFNGMAGIYYGYYNDGDSPSGAIDNNRVHGYRKLSSFAKLASRLNASAVSRLLEANRVYEDGDMATEALLEHAMDEAIVLARKVNAE